MYLYYYFSDGNRNRTYMSELNQLAIGTLHQFSNTIRHMDKFPYQHMPAIHNYTHVREPYNSIRV